MSEELIKLPDFRIACCNLCSYLIRDKINNINNENSAGRNEQLMKIKADFNLSLQLNEIFEIAKKIYKENLANYKYGINNLTEAAYE